MIKGWIGNSAAAALLLLLFPLWVAQEANAGLGLGEARVNSFLGQPLDVEIGLLQPRQEALDSLSVEIASPEDYARLGIPADALGLGLRVEVDRRVDPPVLRLRSSRPVTDPFVQLLITARWASGRMLREYTLFIDPATVPVAPPIRQRDAVVTAPPEAPVPVAEPVPEPPVTEVVPPRPVETEAPAATPVPPQETAEPPREPQPVSEARREIPAERVGPVRSGQTLWSIAQAWRPDETMSMAQVMLAILDQNPQAFINNNVNLLRAGAELLMPDRSAVQAIPRDDAARRVREHNQAWRAAAAPPVVAETAAAIETPPAPEPEQAPEPAPESEPEPAVAAADEIVEPSVPGSGEAQAPDEAALEPLPDLPRLELTSADEELLTDQAFGVERDRLERELAGLVQELRADGIEAPALAAEIDQIRQAIESADVGGLMVASEGLARLEQQARELRMEQERLAEQAAPAPEPPAPTAAASAEQTGPNWLRFLLPALALLLVLALVVLWRRRRSRVDQSEEALEIEPRSSVPAAESPAAQPDADPVDAELAELYRLAERGDKEAFGAALTGLHGRLNNKDDARWIAAAALAATVVPTHPLLSSPNDEGPFEPEAETDHTDASSRELMEWLDADDESALGESAETRSLSSDLDDSSFDDFVERPAEVSGEDEAADLSRLTNRLGPEDEQLVEAGDDVDADLIKAAAEDTVTEDTASGLTERPGDQDEAGDQPLDLDFEFTVKDELPPEGEEDAPVAGEQPPLESVDRQLEFASELDLKDADSEEEDWFKLEPPDEQDMVTRTGAEAEAVEVAKEPLSDDDVELKLDLARAYLSMNDADSARALLEEIVADGAEKHREQAHRLLGNLK